MHVYFLAIGGAGIGPLAQLAFEAGYEVSGSDKQSSAYIDYLKANGITDITIGDSAQVIEEAHRKKPIDWLVYSSAVPMDESGQKQLEAIQKLAIKNTKRDQFISDFVKSHNLKMLAIAGTHGKTTTTAMLSWLFLRLNQPISYLISAKVSFGDMSSFSPDSPYFIYEADEYDRNFLAYEPYLSLISGVSWDHHEIYPTREEYIAAFNEFIKKSNQTIIWQSDADYLKADEDNLRILDDDEPKLANIKLSGLYNRRDAWLAVASVSHLLSVPINDLIKIVNDFPGLSRRMEEIYPNLFSDYAHTPEKVKAAMSVASEIAHAKLQKLIVIYEPLTNRRQLHVFDQYKDCFKGAERVYWLPSYLAREDPKDRILQPAELIAHLEDPSIAEVAEMGPKLLGDIKKHLNEGHMVVAMAGGGAKSLDAWLRENFKTDH